MITLIMASSRCSVSWDVREKQCVKKLKKVRGREAALVLYFLARRFSRSPQPTECLEEATMIRITSILVNE